MGIPVNHNSPRGSLDFVFAFWIMIMFYTTLTSLFSMAKLLLKIILQKYISTNGAPFCALTAKVGKVFLFIYFGFFFW
jgi:hypothetical protein